MVQEAFFIKYSKYLSKIDNIFLLAIAYTEDIKKFGFDVIFEHFVNEMQNLESDEGIAINSEDYT